MQNYEDKARLKISGNQSGHSTPVKDQGKGTIIFLELEVLPVITFWAQKYFELLRNCVREDLPMDCEEEHVIWSRLEELRAAIHNDEHFVRSVERGVMKRYDDGELYANKQTREHVRYTLANGNDNQRRTAALILIAGRLARST